MTVDPNIIIESSRGVLTWYRTIQPSYFTDLDVTTPGWYGVLY